MHSALLAAALLLGQMSAPATPSASAVALPKVLVCFPEWIDSNFQTASPLQQITADAFKARGFSVVEPGIPLPKYNGDDRLKQDALVAAQNADADLLVWGNAFASGKTLMIDLRFTSVENGGESGAFSKTVPVEPDRLEDARRRLSADIAVYADGLAKSWRRTTPKLAGLPKLPPTKAMIFCSEGSKKAPALQAAVETALKQKGFTIVRNASPAVFELNEISQAAVLARKAGADVVVIGESEGPRSNKPAATVQLGMGWADRGSEAFVGTYKEPLANPTPASTRKTLDALAADAIPRFAAAAQFDAARNRPTKAIFWLRVTFASTKTGTSDETWSDLVDAFGSALDDDTDLTLAGRGVRVGGVSGVTAIYEFAVELDEGSEKSESLASLREGFEGKETLGDTACTIQFIGDSVRVTLR